MEENEKKIGSLIRAHRKKSGLTQIELAELAGVGKTAVFDIEKGKLSVRYDTLIKVLEVLSIKIVFHSKFLDLLERKRL